MALLFYLLIVILFIFVEYLAIAISSSQLRRIVNAYVKEKNYVYQRPPHPHRNFLIVQRLLFFVVSFITGAFSLYLKCRYKIQSEYALIAIICLKLLLFLLELKKGPKQTAEDPDLEIIFQDDFNVFVNSWRSNAFIEVITLSIGVFALAILF